MLPCEFCEEIFPERDLMRHQTSCDHNETQQDSISRAQRSSTPGALVSTPPALPSPTRPPPSGFTSSRMSPTRLALSPNTSRSTTPTRPPSSSNTSNSRSTTPTRPPPSVGISNSRSTTPTRPPTGSTSNSSRSSTPTRLPPSGSSVSISNSKNSSQSRTQTTNTSCGIKSPPTSPPPRPRRPTPSSPPSSRGTSYSNTTPTPTITNTSPSTTINDGFISPSESRPSSVSPCHAPSVSSSSGISSGASSFSGVSSSSSFSSSSVSTTPSTSSSASPVPVIATSDTPTDVEADFDDEEDQPFSRPRRGRLLSSAIFSWRNISGSKGKDRPKYTRSNTAPLEDTGDCETPPPGVITSHSASQLPLAPSPDPSSPENTDPPPIPPKYESKKQSPPKQISESKSSSQHSYQQQKTEEKLSTQKINHQTTESNFIKKQNKYKAPQPPKVQNEKYSKSNNEEYRQISVDQCEHANDTKTLTPEAIDIENSTNNKISTDQNNIKSSPENSYNYSTSPSNHKHFPSPGVPEHHRFYPANHSDQPYYSTIPNYYDNYYSENQIKDYSDQEYNYIDKPSCYSDYNLNNYEQNENTNIVRYQSSDSPSLSDSSSDPASTYVVHGFLKLDSKPLMANDSKICHPCAFCNKRISPDKLSYHQVRILPFLNSRV